MYRASAARGFIVLNLHVPRLLKYGFVTLHSFKTEVCRSHTSHHLFALPKNKEKQSWSFCPLGVHCTCYPGSYTQQESELFSSRSPLTCVWLNPKIRSRPHHTDSRNSVDGVGAPSPPLEFRHIVSVLFFQTTAYPAYRGPTAELF